MNPQMFTRINLFIVLFISPFFLSNVLAQCPEDVIVSSSGTIQVWDVEVDASDNVYTISGFTGTVQLGDFVFTQDQEYGLIVTKTDPLGNILWARKVEGTSFFFATNPSLELDPFGNIVIAASEFVSPEEHVLRIEAYDERWTQLWGKRYIAYGSASNLPYQVLIMPYDIVVDGEGNIYVTGALSGKMDFNGTALSAADNTSETFLLKLNSSQNES